MIYHPCYSIIHKLKKLSPSFQVSKKYRKIIQNENTTNIWDLFPFVIFKRELLTDVYRAEVTFLIPIEYMDFFSLVLLFCAALLLTVLFLFQKAAINKTLISKESLCDFMLWN